MKSFKLAIVLIWNIHQFIVLNVWKLQNCHIKISGTTLARGVGQLKYCGFDIGRSQVSELIIKVSTCGWHICILQCHNNLSLMLCIMHELKMNYSPIKPNLKINITKQRLVIWTEKIFPVECYIRVLFYTF